jgi:hypothetical protein
MTTSKPGAGTAIGWSVTVTALRFRIVLRAAGGCCADAMQAAPRPKTK